MFRILAVNPGSTSTKIALFDDEKLIVRQVVEHPHHEIARLKTVSAQEEMRRKAILAFLTETGVDLKSLSALVARGGILRPIPGGVYLVDEEMYTDLKKARFGSHASNLGVVICWPLSGELGIPAYTVDTVATDELVDEARLSGLKGIPRQSLSHALNSKAAARRAARELKRRYLEVNLVVAHLGSGISVSAHQNGKMVDVNNANSEGPFSLERCGTLPSLSLADLCFQGGHTHEETERLLTREGGVYSYLKTKDFREVIQWMKEGNLHASLVVKSLAWQVSKEIGAMGAVLRGEVDGVVITGGMAYSQTLVGLISSRVTYLGPLFIYPGEEEMEALAAGALRALRGEQKPLHYKDIPERSDVDDF